MFDIRTEKGEDFDSQKQNRSQAIELNNMENLELENLSENQQLSNSEISSQQHNNQIIKLILNINLILALSYIVQIFLGISIFLILWFTIWKWDNFIQICEYNKNQGQIENCYVLISILISLIIINLLVLIAVRFLKFLWKYQIWLNIFVSIIFIMLNAVIWDWLFSMLQFHSNQFQQYGQQQYTYQGEIQQDEPDQQFLLNEVKISLARMYFYFNFQLGIILLQTHITYKMSTNKQINLIFTNFIVSILCGCSVIFLPSYTILSFYYKDLIQESDFVDPDPLQWRWEGFIINPVLFSIYTFLYIRSVKQIQNGKFQLRDDQKYIGALLIFINMFIF